MIVLDTHAWVWFVSDPQKLSKRAGKAVDEAINERGILVSTISAWEVALLVAKKRLRLSFDVYDWVANCERIPFMHFVPLDTNIAIKSVQLPPPLHEDPADRIIVATALAMGASLVTKDKKLRNYSHVPTIW